MKLNVVNYLLFAPIRFAGAGNGHFKREQAVAFTCSMVGETGVGWDKLWLGQCPSVPNESPDRETNDVFGEHVTTAFTGAARIIDARFVSVISPKVTFLPQK